ncbi:hypothetical protein ACFSZT_28400 [Prauserella oleivorans]
MRDDIVTTERQTAVIGVLCDRGWPAELMRPLAESVSTVLARRVSSQVGWRLEVRAEELTLDADGKIPMERMATQRLTDEGWDYLLLLTDLPRLQRTRPILADIDMEHRVGLISLPAIGWLRLRQHLADTVVHVIGVLTSGARHALPGSGRGKHHVRRRPTEITTPVRQVPSEDGHAEVCLVLTGVRGWLRLLFGMVRDNRPWRLVPSLSKALAAAAAVASFGIFYPTIWGMADAQSPARLLVISALAVTAMVAWLIMHHGLWERPRESEERRHTLLYNTASVLTLSLGAACAYFVLFVLLLLAAMIVISTSYLRSHLQHPVTMSDYIALAWLAGSMGTVAGAVGSTLETDEDIRHAAYSKRERQRRARRHAEQTRDHGTET